MRISANRSKPGEAGSAGWRSQALVCLGLGALTLFSFWSLGSAGFINTDDDIYVTANARVQRGITADNVRWAFTTDFMGYYYPLTWLSHMLDCELFGLDGGGHHSTSVLIHALNAMLLFLALRSMTGAVWRSAAAAALFAVHPLHVESVAWISERKDVLCAMFWFMALLFYARYAKKPSLPRYSLVFAMFLLGLLCKPMIVTLPFLLLLLDHWPLDRWRREKPGWRFLVVEKLPLMALVPVFSWVTVSAQKKLSAVVSAEAFPIGERVANALVSYVSYIGDAFWPVGLAAYYPLDRGSVSHAAAALSFCMLAAVTTFALLFMREKGYLAVGWFWFLGTLVPVIGLVQVGLQARADRYTYIPLVGIFIMAAWGAAGAAGESPVVRKLACAGFAATILVLAFLSARQAATWKDSISVHRNSIRATKGNWFAHNNLGTALYQAGFREEALAHFEEAARLNPRYAAPRANLGSAAADRGENGKAVAYYEEALRISPRSPRFLNALGLALIEEGRSPEAVERIREAVNLEPGFFGYRINLGWALYVSGDVPGAVEQYREALRLEPGSELARANLEKAEKEMK